MLKSEHAISLDRETMPVHFQFKLMSIYPDRPTEQSLSEFAAAVNQSASNQVSAGTTPAATTDAGVFLKPAPPPKYEDLEQVEPLKQFQSHDFY